MGLGKHASAENVRERWLGETVAAGWKPLDAADALVLEGSAASSARCGRSRIILVLVAVGERRAVLGRQRDGKPTLFNAITGDSRRRRDGVASSGEESTDLPALRADPARLRRTYHTLAVSVTHGPRQSFWSTRGVSRAASASSGRARPITSRVATQDVPRKHPQGAPAERLG